MFITANTSQLSYRSFTNQKVHSVGYDNIDDSNT